jgi:YD repeat-containing protein
MRADYRYDDYARLVRRSFVDKVLGDGIETYTYDADTANSISDGTLRSMRMVSGGNIVYQYDGLQRLTNKDIAGEVWETFTYSNTQVSSKINYIGDTRVHSLHYLYDGNGNITKETLSEGGVQTSRNYAYDKLNQLTQVKENGVVKETYAYDNAGNITSFNNGSTQNHTLVYGDAQWKDLLTEVDGEAITYDAIGNPLT